LQTTFRIAIKESLQSFGREFAIGQLAFACGAFDQGGAE
jgi:hypothetical protein